MKRLFVFFTLSALCFAACTKTKDATTDINNVNVMFINACAYGPHPLALDGKVNNTTDSTTGIPIILRPVYHRFNASNNADISFWLSPGSTMLIDKTVDLSYNHFYTAFAYGPADAPRITVARDTLSIPPAGMAKVRFANLCPGTGIMQCTFGSTMLDSVKEGEVYDSFGVVSKTLVYSVTGFTVVAPGTGTLVMKDSLHPAYTAYIYNQTFSADHIYTVFITDTSLTTPAGFYLNVITNY